MGRTGMRKNPSWQTPVSLDSPASPASLFRKSHPPLDRPHFDTNDVTPFTQRRYGYVQFSVLCYFIKEMAEAPRSIHFSSGESQRMRHAANTFAESHAAEAIVHRMKQAVVNLCRDTQTPKEAAVAHVIQHVADFVGNQPPPPESNPSPPPDDWVEPTSEELQELERLLGNEAAGSNRHPNN